MLALSASVSQRRQTEPFTAQLAGTNYGPVWSSPRSVAVSAGSCDGHGIQNAVSVVFDPVLVRFGSVDRSPLTSRAGPLLLRPLCLSDRALQLSAVFDIRDRQSLLKLIGGTHASNCRAETRLAQR